MKAIIAAILIAALTGAMWTALSNGRPMSLLSASVAVVAAAAGVVVWRTSDAGGHMSDQRSRRSQAGALLVSGVGVSFAVMFREHTAPIITAAALISMVLLTHALLGVPQDASNPAARVRRGLDGLFVSSCLMFTVLVGAFPAGGAPALFSRHYFAVAAAVGAIALLGLGLVSAVRATSYRRCFCGVASSLVVLGASQAGIVVMAVARPSDFWGEVFVLSWGLACTATAICAWVSRWRPGLAVASPIPRADMAVTVVPAVLGCTAALFHGFYYGPLGVDGIVLAMLVLAILTVRQVLSRIDVRRFAQELADREAYFRSIVSDSSDITTVLDDNLRITFHAAASNWRADIDGRDIVGSSFSDIVHPDESSMVDRKLRDLLDAPPQRRIRVDARIRDNKDQWRETESIVADQRDDPHVRGVVVHTRDVAERRSLERELAKLAFTDPLTMLSNRRALLRTLESDVVGGSMPCSLLAIDLDGFKNVNDSQGHDIGDSVLMELARRLRSSLRPTDLAARLGGDEFAVLLWCPPDDGYEIAERLLSTLSQPYTIGDRAPVFVSTSIGLAGCETADDVQSLLRNADLALRSAKQQGKNKIEAYDSSFERRVRRRNTLEHELHGAIERGELALVYQPVISLPHGRIVGAEALMRWNHPELGAVSPGEFIPVVEDAGQSHILASWTVKEVANRLAVWKAAGHTAWISMNLSPRQFHSPRFATDLAQSLLGRGVPPSRLVIEITEQEVAQDADVLAAQLAAIRGTGVRIALDDFGAGYSSLGQLHRLPVDILKIDRDLVAGSDDGPAPLSDIVVRLGERLGLQVIAEGVESQIQLEVVKAAGCPMVQGYLLARPMAADKVDEMLVSEARMHLGAPLAIES